MKLKLLENEDHLFDAGLYLGFVGTIISLILVSLYFTFNLPSLIVEFFWLLISLYGIGKYFVRRDS